MDLEEFEFIDRIKASYGVLGKSAFGDDRAVFGIGDDCAVIPYKEDLVYLISKDVLIEGVHFELDRISLKDLGWKSIAVNLSDIAAMGACPHYIFIALGIPSSFSYLELSHFYDGLSELLGRFNLSLLGGDTSRSLKHFMISITIVGSCLKDKVIYRKGASLGDNIYITGTLGDSGLGFFLTRKDYPVLKAHKDYLISRHTRPNPRVEEMLYLNDLYKITSGVDISDGLSSDLSHILKASSCGAILDMDSLPKSLEFRTFAIDDTIDKEDVILSFGEDYEILFTSPETISLDASLKFEKRFGISLSKIGVVTENGLYVRDKGRLKKLLVTGYKHFS